MNHSLIKSALPKRILKEYDYNKLAVAGRLWVFKWYKIFNTPQVALTDYDPRLTATGFVGCKLYTNGVLSGNFDEVRCGWLLENCIKVVQDKNEGLER